MSVVEPRLLVSPTGLRVFLALAALIARDEPLRVFLRCSRPGQANNS